MFFQKWWFIRSVLKHGSPVISPLEKRGIEKYGETPPVHPPLFILGPPRSGSTIIYQVITSLMDVAYIDNLANLARYNPYFGMWLSQRFFHQKTHSSFTSAYGQTTKDGLHAPAEALFFYKWFPQNRHYTELSDLSDKQISEFRNTVHALINRAQKPLVIKNLSFSLRLQALREIFPEARYMVIRRDPLYTSQSLLQAMRKNRVPDGKVWGILPKDFRQLEQMEPHRKVVHQIHMIEQQIYRDLDRVPRDQVLFADYEELDTGLEELLGSVAAICGSEVKRRPGTPVPDLSVKNRDQLPEEDLTALRSHIEQLNWELHNC